MNTKSYIFYSFILICLILFVIIGLHELSIYFNATFSVFPILIYKAVMFFPVGVLLGLPKIIRERRKPGKWSFNYTFFLVLGLPSLIFTFLPFIHYFVINFPDTIVVPLMNTGYFSIFSLVLGYALITNFRKRTIGNSSR